MKLEDREEEGVRVAFEENFKCVGMARIGHSDKALCYSGESASKVAIKPERTKKMSPPFCEKVVLKSAMSDLQWESRIGVDVKGDKGILFGKHQEAWPRTPRPVMPPEEKISEIVVRCCCTGVKVEKRGHGERKGVGV